MIKSVETKKMGNFNMASAADRVVAFWELYPKGKISVERNDYEGNLVYKAFIWKDKATFMDAVKSGVPMDILMETADAIAEARNETALNKKDFEKLQTISIGRALAIMGFTKDGRIASDEELELYKSKAGLYDAAEYKAQKQELLDSLDGSSDLEVLQAIWTNAARANVRLIQDEECIKVKDAMKDKFTKPKKEKKDAAVPNNNSGSSK